MFGVAFEIGVILLLVLFNGVFAMAECAVVSSRRSRLQQMANEHARGAQAALDLLRTPTTFLSTVQIGITLIGIVAGAYGGQALTADLAAWLSGFEALVPYSATLAFVLVVGGITFVSLVVGELLPKRLALAGPERIAALVAAPMKALARAAGPAVKVLDASTEVLARVLRVKHAGDQAVSEEEVKILIDQGAQAGIFETAEKDIVYNVFRFTDRRVGSIMTLRADIVWVDVDRPLAENVQRIAASRHSYFPVCRGSFETVLGMISVKTLWARRVAGSADDLTDGLLRPLYVPRSMPALRLLETFKRTGKHIALVVDEFGSVQGLVTLIDVLEAIVGDLPPTGEPAEEPIVRRDDGSWLVDGLVPSDRLKEVFRFRALPGEDKGHFQTLGGFVVAQLGRIPNTGDRFEWSGFRFEVLDMDGNRVDKVMLTPLHGGTPPAAPAPK